MGPPGAGKGSLSKLCAERFSWKQLSTGDLCRMHIQERSEVGRQIDFSIKSGKLISDELIAQMVEQWLIEQLPGYDGVILDGFPRTLVQAKFLHDFLQKKMRQCTLNIVKICVSDSEILKRLKDRYVCVEKSCQAVYSYRSGSKLMPQVLGVCDYCSSKLVQRVDDHLDSIQHRLKTYHSFDKDLLTFYENQGHDISEINGEQSLNNVFEELKALIDA